MKKTLRNEMRARLRALPAPVYLPVGILAILAERYAKSPAGFATILAYLAHGNEIDPGSIMEVAIAQGAIVAAPRVIGDDMSFRIVASARDRFERGAFGLREPLESAPRLFGGQGAGPEALGDREFAFPLLAIVPGLAFSRSGHRLGRGKGYYDRFLAALLAAYPDRRAEICLAGACHEFQILDAVPTEAHDIPVDCLLTEKGCILCE